MGRKLKTSLISYLSKFIYIKINPKVNEIRGKVIEIHFEKIAIHIAIRFKNAIYHGTKITLSLQDHIKLRIFLSQNFKLV